MQISLIMLIGLLAKNAILIVQFALERRRTGMAIKWSAVLGAASRLRPSLMGAAAVGGMLIGMILQIFVVPALFVMFQWLQEKVKPITFEDNNANVDSELLQYSRPIDDKKNDNVK